MEINPKRPYVTVLAVGMFVYSLTTVPVMRAFILLQQMVFERDHIFLFRKAFWAQPHPNSSIMVVHRFRNLIQNQFMKSRNWSSIRDYSRRHMGIPFQYRTSGRKWRELPYAVATPTANIVKDNMLESAWVKVQAHNFLVNFKTFHSAFLHFRADTIAAITWKTVN